MSITVPHYDDDVPWDPPEYSCEEWEFAAGSLPATTDADVLAGLSGPAHEADLSLLASVDVSGLDDPHDRVVYLKALDRVAGLVAAMRCDALVAFAGAVSAQAYLPELHVEQELAVAARVSRYSAGRQIETARALTTTFPSFRDALRAGEISSGHVAVLVDRTRVVADPDALAGIERVALPKARRMTPGEFARECTALVARFDPDAAARARRAVAGRRLTVRELEDGMGYLGLVHDWTTIAAIEQTVRADGRRLQKARRAADREARDLNGGTASEADCHEGDETADACRADALAARLLGEVGADGEITWERETPRVEVQVVVDLATLRGEVENPCLLDGMPVPADLARHLAGYATAFRRLVTDPVTGHLLDYGRRVYLPDPLRTYVLARDGGCTTPGCTSRAASRLQLDHATPFPVGPSDTTNTHGLCTTCHQLKTAGYAYLTHTSADGSHIWHSPWGQSVHIPPRAVLPGLDDAWPPDPPPSPAPPPGDDPPPF